MIRDKHVFHFLQDCMILVHAYIYQLSMHSVVLQGREGIEFIAKKISEEQNSI